jgi:protease IV
MDQNQLASELFADKRAERRLKYIRLGVIATIAVAYLTLLVGARSMANDRAAEAGGPHVAVVDITGEIGPGKDASLRALAPVLKEAFDDKAAKAVVLRINSPGGTPVQSSLLHDEIVRLRQKRPELPVYAVGEDMVTSGAYLIAMSADKLVVNRSTMAGSIGVIIRSFGFTGLMEKVGIERRALTAGESKNQLDPFGPFTEEDKQSVAGMLENVHQHFKDIVLAARKDKLKKDPSELFTGAVWTGSQAVELGLADQVGSLQTVMAEVGAVKTRVYSVKVPLLEALTRSFGVSVTKTLIAETGSTPAAVELLPR